MVRLRMCVHSSTGNETETAPSLFPFSLSLLKDVELKKIPRYSSGHKMASSRGRKLQKRKNSFSLFSEELMPLSSSCATPEFPPSVTDTKARRILADPSPELYFSSYLLELAKGVCSLSPLPLNRRHHNKGAVTSRASTNQRPDRPTFTLSAFAWVLQYNRFLRMTASSYLFIITPYTKYYNPPYKNTKYNNWIHIYI